jgi:hypothetical protein
MSHLKNSDKKLSTGENQDGRSHPGIRKVKKKYLIPTRAQIL